MSEQKENISEQILEKTQEEEQKTMEQRNQNIEEQQEIDQNKKEEKELPKRKPSDLELELQLGDVIQITNPVNEILNDQIFMIDYIDILKAYLINADTLERVKVKINPDGVLGDGNITKIAILSRPDTPSYARQHELLPGKWVNIYFGGDFPVIITGEITNLEEDMIEVTTAEKDTLYINFDYKGIPEDLPIENIEIREKPVQIISKLIKGELEEMGEDEEGNDEEGNDEEQGTLEELEREKQVVPLERIQVGVRTKDIKEQLREFIVKADQIKFGDEELGPIIQYIDVSAKAQRFSIETQVADLLDDLLSTIPNAQRTPRVLNNIHTMIELFKQLREHFSTFDQYGNVESAVLKEATYKPLKNWLQSFSTNLYWILPVVKNIKKVYNVENIDEENNDLINIDLSQDIRSMKSILDGYKSNNLGVESNKYSVLYSELSKYFIPFNLIDDENVNSVLIEKEVNCDINTIVDNLEDMYSSIFAQNNIRNRRFVVTRYNLGQTKLDTTDSSGAKMVTVRVPIIPNDTMSVRSLVTLQEPTIRFSKIGLPGTNMLDRANLNQTFLNYWQLLKKNTNMNVVLIDSLNNEIDFDENNFVNSVRNYVFNVPEEDLKGISREDAYTAYTNTIVPKIRILFGLMKKYINGKLSIVEVVSYLEPFLIYTDDLTFKQYLEIVEFIDTKISDYNRNMIEFSRIFKVLSNIKSNPQINSLSFTVVEMIQANLRNEVFDTGYGFDDPKKITDSELLRKLTLKDYSRLYTTTIALQNVPLMFPKDVSDLIEQEKGEVEDNLKREGEEEYNETANKCDTIVIAKMYTSSDQLHADDDVIIFFDKRYDKTNYGVMEDHNGYAKEVINLTHEELKDHITKDQMKKNGISESDAAYIAETLIDGNKRVIDGQYALLYKGYAENVTDETDYYVRKQDKWVLDSDMSKSNKGVFSDESSLLCDLQEKCINVTSKSGEKCETMKTNELNLQNSLLKNIINEFDSKYKISKQEFEKEIREKFDYFLSIMPVLSKLETNNLLKYNNQKYKLGAHIDEQDMDNNGGAKIRSPFVGLLDIILGQQDFVKKQRDILTFADKFTRPSIGVRNITPGGAFENEYWLYCIKTNVPLLPVFKKVLANAYVKSEYDYKYVLEEIKSSIGQLSDDGDWWTDKHTGWPICPGDFDVEEGYDEGFRVSSRAIMEADAGNKIMSATTERKVKYITAETIMINNIVNALSVAMGINVESQKDFIINSVVETIRNTVESESDYKEKVKQAAQKGKKSPSYRDFFNTSLLYYTLGLYLIAIQTSIPSIRTRKTHPGCVRSFSGYPFEGTGDISSISYLACVAYDIRESGEPWNVLKKTNAEKIQARIKAGIDDFLLALPEVRRKFEEKTEYLLTNSATTIPDEHDIAKWSDFLPPLVPFKIKHLVNISDEFKKALVSDLRNGSEKQREKILVVESKIIQFSLAIQERIQEIVRSHRVLLHTANNEPYLENACCNSKENEPTIDYFMSRSKDIEEFNQIVDRLTRILTDIRGNTESELLYSNINTKMVYPPIANTFDDRTIYMAFIFYCKFKSLMPMPQDLLPVCTGKPDTNLINPADPIDRIIKNLKDDGRNYTNEQFLRLIQLVSRENIIHIDIDNPVISTVAKLSYLLEAMYDENNEDEIIELALRDLIGKAIDTFDIASPEYTKEVKDLNNYLIRSNEDMTAEIIEFVQKNSGSNVTRSAVKKFVDTMNNISSWAFDISTRNEDSKISSESIYSVTNFYKTYINNFVSIFPNIILNKVNYNDTHIPSYYGFSVAHANKLKKYIAEYYDKLKAFYGVPTLLNILPTIQRAGRNTIRLANVTPCFSSIKIGETVLKGVIDERTSRFLFEYYLLRIMDSYIALSDEDDMVVTEVKKEVDVTDIFSTDYLDETETRIDLGFASRTETQTRVLTGNKLELRQKVAELLVAFMDIFRNEKETIDTNYEDIQDRVFKLREREKDMVTDRLKAMTDEERDIDTILKVTKQGMYSKGMQKGLTMYDKDFYEEEQGLRDEMISAERKIRNKNKDAVDENMDILVDEYLEQNMIDAGIDADAYDMSYMNEDYFDGNTDGVDAPEEEHDDYMSYY